MYTNFQNEYIAKDERNNRWPYSVNSLSDTEDFLSPSYDSGVKMFYHLQR